MADDAEGVGTCRRMGNEEGRGSGETEVTTIKPCNESYYNHKGGNELRNHERDTPSSKGKSVCTRPVGKA